MSRPKGAYIASLAEQAESDLSIIKSHKVALKLKAISAIAKFPAESVAEIMGVSVQTVWRWVAVYKKDGMDGLYPKPKKPKPSKLSEEQKAKVLSWLSDAKTAGGECAHWTLSHLRHAITEEFGVVLGINTIWVWLRKEGWKLKVPRPRHHSADEQAQGDFKKKRARRQPIQRKW
jgi:transposase